MKKVIKLTAAIALMFVTVTGMANEPKILLQGSEKSFVFELDSRSTATIIQLVDIDDNIIFKETVLKGTDYAKRFDLNKLESGDYYLKVQDPIKEIVYTVNLDGAGTKVIAKKENNKPVFRKEGNIVFLNLLNLDLDKVKIDVYDSSNRVLFSERIDGMSIVQKAFNFEQAFKDSYTVVVKDGGNIYYEDIVIK